jgi:uncharacterized cupin superfamily protein
MIMPEVARPIAIIASDAPTKGLPAEFPAKLASRMVARSKRPLGDPFGLKTFGVNLTRLAPGAWSMVHHKHKIQDEFVYVLEGTPVLVTDAGETQLSPGMCAGFPADGPAHHLENRSISDVVILEVGDRGGGEEVVLPNDNVRAITEPNGGWRFMQIDGSSL